MVEPLLKDRLQIATGKAADAADDAEGSLAGLAIWASLSEEAALRLREQIAAGVFPVRLKPMDWASGDKVWRLDVVAPTRQLASAVRTNLTLVRQGLVNRRTLDWAGAAQRRVWADREPSA